MAKSLTFVWELLGMRPWYQTDVASHGHMLNELRSLLKNESVKCHHTKTLPLHVDSIRKVHKEIETGGSIGKNGLEVEPIEKVFSCRCTPRTTI